MSDQEKLKGATQENVLTLLCYDDKSARLLINAITPSLFQSKIYREIAERAFDFVMIHKVAPKDHIVDEFTEELEGDKKDLYSDIFTSMNELSKNINSEYVMRKLKTFISEQNLKGAIFDAVELVENGKTEDARALLSSNLDPDFSMFDPGVFLNKGLGLLQTNASAAIQAGYHVGIDPLDDRGFHLQSKQMLLMMASSGKGKTWWLVHLGKMALLQGAKILHITLEVSDRVLMTRYMQTLFSISKRHGRVLYPNIMTKQKGKGLMLDFEEVNRPALEDENVYSIVRDQLKRLAGKGNNLLIKEFPMRQLTVPLLKAYMETLDSQYSFLPDVVIIDYPDLFDIDPRYKREQTGKVYEELRGMCTDGNFALAAVTQANRAATKARIITRDNVAEDLSKVNTSDLFITYNQTEFEKDLSLARLWVDKARNDVDGYLTLIAQSYHIGQFCMGSTLMSRRLMDEIYPDELERLSRKKAKEGIEENDD